MAIFITGSSSISGQSDIFRPITYTSTDTIKAVEPDFTAYINKRSLRRMDRLSRYGLYTARAAMDEAGRGEAPDGIVLGIGQTFSENPGSLLRKMIGNNEGLMNPTAFMNSLLSTAAGQLALQLKCRGYTNTFTQRGFSFEAALKDGISQLGRFTPGSTVVVGGVDTYCEDHTALASTYGHIGNSSGSERQVGEGAAAFVLSSSPEQGYRARIDRVTTQFSRSSRTPVELDRLVRNLMPTKVAQPDLILFGIPRDGEANDVYAALEGRRAAAVSSFDYKAYCGEYPTAAAFGLHLAIGVLNGEVSLPELADKTYRNILLINNYGERYFSAIQLANPAE